MLATILNILIGLTALTILGLFLFSRMTTKKIEQALPPKGRHTQVSGGRIHHVVKGEGAPVLMIHGLSGSLGNFTYATTEPLSKDFLTIAIDRPGCGYSERDSDELARLPEQARLIAEFIEAERLERPLVIGHSLGGAIGLALALDHPDKVGALSLIAPLTAPQETGPDVFKALVQPSPLARRAIAETLAVPLGIRRGPETVATVFGPCPVPEDFSVRGGGLLSLRPRGFYAASTDMHAVPLDIAAQAARYGELETPVGMIYGDEDRVLDPDTHIRAVHEARPDMHLVRLPGVGHMVQITRPDETEAFIRRMAEVRRS